VVASEALEPRLELVEAGPVAADGRRAAPAEAEADWPVLLDLAVDRDYELDYGGAHVLDCGAQHGFFGAYALARGASGVVSYEPDGCHFEALARAAQGRPAWRTVHAAVGARDGIERRSCPHGEESVRVVSLAEVLGRAAREADGAPVVVKLALGGTEAKLIAATPVEVWAPVSTVLVASAEGRKPVTRRLGVAGLELSRQSNDVLHFTRG
jgi:FkbM family methyltransferase